MQTKFAVLNDLHFADQPPIGRVEGYVDHLFDKLSGVSDYMYNNQVAALILTGDVFHQKRPSFVSHRLVSRLIRAFHDDFQQVYVVPGNHDLSHAGMESLFQQPLGVLIDSGAVMPLLKDEPSVFSNPVHFNQEILLLGREYDTNDDTDPYYYLPTEQEAAEMDKYPSIMVAHGSIVPSKADPIYPHVKFSQIPWEDAIPNVLVCGHLHEDWGTEKRDGCTYVNFGSFSRVSRSADMRKSNERYMAILTITDKGVTVEKALIPNVKPADEVFISMSDETEDDDALAEFASQLAQSIVLEEMSVSEALDQFGDIDKEVRDRVLRYFEEAGL